MNGITPKAPIPTPTPIPALTLVERLSFERLSLVDEFVALAFMFVSVAPAFCDSTVEVDRVVCDFVVEVECVVVVAGTNRLISDCSSST